MSEVVCLAETTSSCRSEILKLLLFHFVRIQQRNDPPYLCRDMQHGGGHVDVTARRREYPR